MRASQRGNAVIFVLLAIALFAGLAYTFMRGAKSGQGNLTAGQAKLGATEIINYATRMGHAVEKLRNRGCSENNINFGAASGVWSTMYNPTSPADHTCDIFNAAGAGMEPWLIPSTYIVNANPSAWIIQTKSFFDVFGTPTTKSDLVIIYSELTLPICKAINRQLGLTDDEPEPEDFWMWSLTDYTDYNKYYDVDPADALASDPAAPDYQRMAACITWNGTGFYQFYQVLAAN